MGILGERFFKLSNAMFCYHLTPIQFTVYSFLVSSAGQKLKCWPSVKTIAANCACSANAARAAINELERRGFIRRVARYQDRPNGNVRQTSNAYFILDPPPLPISRGAPPHEMAGYMNKTKENKEKRPLPRRFRHERGQRGGESGATQQRPAGARVRPTVPHREAEGPYTRQDSLPRCVEPVTPNAEPFTT